MGESIVKFWQVDAFASELFSGNPAAVFLFKEAPAESLMQKIAREMSLSETAFVIGTSERTIRWFTPEAEVSLCGHATLAAAHILWQEGLVEGAAVVFQSKSGPLTVTRSGRGYTLDFPRQDPLERDEHYALVSDILGFAPQYVGSNGEDCVVATSDADAVYSFSPDLRLIASLPERGFLLTAPGKAGPYDYIYRAFFPKLGVPEDPVTGSANTSLAPYWAERLGKNKLLAAQVSARGGQLLLKVIKERVLITGSAVTVFEGIMQTGETCES